MNRLWFRPSEVPAATAEPAQASSNDAEDIEDDEAGQHFYAEVDKRIKFQSSSASTSTVEFSSSSSTSSLRSSGTREDDYQETTSISSHGYEDEEYVGHDGYCDYERGSRRDEENGHAARQTGFDDVINANMTRFLALRGPEPVVSAPAAAGIDLDLDISTTAAMLMGSGGASVQEFNASQPQRTLEELEEDNDYLDYLLETTRNELQNERNRGTFQAQRRLKRERELRKRIREAQQSCERLLRTSPTDTLSATSGRMGGSVGVPWLRRTTVPAFTVSYPHFREYTDTIIRVFQEPDEIDEDESENDDGSIEERNDSSDQFDSRDDANVNVRTFSPRRWSQQQQPQLSVVPCCTRGARREARLVQTWHQQLVYVNHLKAISVDCNVAILDLYRRVIPILREEQSVAEAVALSNVCKAHARLVKQDDLYQRVLSIQEELIERFEESEGGILSALLALPGACGGGHRGSNHDSMSSSMSDPSV